MKDKLVVEFPEGSDEFVQGMILVDEAVGRFMESSHPLAFGFELMLSSLVRGVEALDNDLCQDEE